MRNLRWNGVSHGFRTRWLRGRVSPAMRRVRQHDRTRLARPCLVMRTILIILGFVGLLAGAIAWTVWQWNLCRDGGMSFWYCVQHIS